MAWRRRLPLAVVAFLICTSCGDARRGSDVRADDPLYPGPAGEVFRLLFTRTISFRVLQGTSERRVQRVQTGDLPTPPYAEWEEPTFDDAELARIERLLDRTVAEDPLRGASLLQRALF